MKLLGAHDLIMMPLSPKGVFGLQQRVMTDTFGRRPSCASLSYVWSIYPALEVHFHHLDCIQELYRDTVDDLVHVLKRDDLSLLCE